MHEAAYRIELGNALHKAFGRGKRTYCSVYDKVLSLTDSTQPLQQPLCLQEHATLSIEATRLHATDSAELPLLHEDLSAFLGNKKLQISCRHALRLCK